MLSVPPDAVCHFFTTLREIFAGLGVGVFVGGLGVGVLVFGVGVGVSVGGVPVGGVVGGVSSPVFEIFVTLNSIFVLAALWASRIGI